jgi:hypothetical protein
VKLKKTAKITGLVCPADVSAKVGSAVYLDHRTALCRRLRACDWWDKADFAWDVFCDGPIKELAANVYVTGRTVQWKSGCQVVRVRVEFVGDGEPSTFANGWMYFETANVEYGTPVACS